MKRHISACTIAILLLFSTIAGATYLPSNIVSIESYLNSSYFGAYHEVFSLDFAGMWDYTAVAHESGNWNITEEAATGPVSFTTTDYSNWGLWNQVDFDSDNIFFSDSNGPYNVELDPFASQSLFRIFQLDEMSSLLSYLDNPISLASGTYIIGFNDNGDPSDGDSDFDDLIIAATPVAPVPEPSTILLLGIGLFALGWYGRKRRQA